MNYNKKYVAFAMVAVLAIAGMSFGAFGSAQTVTTLTCSTAGASVAANQAAILTATGGNGTYFWSGQNLNVGNSGGNKFAVSYPQDGVYTVTVSSAGQSANCSVNVVTPSTGALSCSPAVQNVTLGNSAVVSVAGGNGSYIWSASDLNISNPNGTSFTANYASTGLKTLTVTSAGLVTTCAINVVAGASVPPPVVTPGLPATGGGFGQ